MSDTRARGFAARLERLVSDDGGLAIPTQAHVAQERSATRAGRFGYARRCLARPQRPRLVVTRSARHISAQVIDDTQGRTLASASTMEADAARGEW